MLPRTTAARTIETGASRPMSRCCSRAEITLTAIPTNTAPTIAGLVYCPRIRETSSAPGKELPWSELRVCAHQTADTSHHGKDCEPGQGILKQLAAPGKR